MKSRKRIWKDTKGETLVEVIVSVVLVLSAVGVFATAAATAGRINVKVEEMDNKMYEAIKEAESRNTPSPSDAVLRIRDTGDATILIPITIQIYGTDMQAFSYEEDGS